MLPARDPAEMRGDFIAILTANPRASGSRPRKRPESRDGLNLAHVLRGNLSGESTRRLADTLFTLVAHTVGPEDLVLDLHFGTVELQSGQRLGVLIDPFGNVLAEVASPVFGSALAICDTPPAALPG